MTTISEETKRKIFSNAAPLLAARRRKKNHKKIFTLPHLVECVAVSLVLVLIWSINKTNEHQLYYDSNGDNIHVYTSDTPIPVDDLGSISVYSYSEESYDESI